MNLFTSVDITLADIHVAPTVVPEQSATISSPGSPSHGEAGTAPTNHGRPRSDSGSPLSAALLSRRALRLAGRRDGRWCARASLET
jgi:hypothetical protein